MKKYILPIILYVIGIGLVIFGCISFATRTSFKPSSMIGSFACLFIGTFILIAGNIILGIKRSKIVRKNYNKMTQTILDGNKEEQPNDIYDVIQNLRKSSKQNNQNKCKYCGAILNEEDTKCPNCGAKDVD